MKHYIEVKQRHVAIDFLVNRFGHYSTSTVYTTYTRYSTRSFLGVGYIVYGVYGAVQLTVGTRSTGMGIGGASAALAASRLTA